LGTLMLWQLLIFKAGIGALRAAGEIPDDALWSYALTRTLIAAADFVLLGLAIFWIVTKRQPGSVWLAISAIWVTVISTKLTHWAPLYPPPTVAQKIEAGLQWLIYLFATLYLLSSERVAALYNSARLPLFRPRRVVATLRGRT
ncbi:MAG TPA: hypothetical protein VF079_01565, partial [Sphingomicrobium sp.]